MNRLAILTLGLLVGGTLAWYFATRGSEPVGRDAHRAFARAKAQYINETNAGYRRARAELAPLASALGDRSVVFLVDLALIDLQEINHMVDGESRTLDEDGLQLLLASALRHLQRAQELDPENDAVAYNLARTYIKYAEFAQNRDELRRRAADLLLPLTHRRPPDPSATLLLARLHWDEDRFQEAHDTCLRVLELGEDYVPATIYAVARHLRAQALQRLDPEKGTAMLEQLGSAPKAGAGALERGRYTEFLAFSDYPASVPRPRSMTWTDVTARTGLPALGEPPYFIAPDVDRDCARDLVVNAAGGMRLLRNRRNATFEDVTAESGLPDAFVLAAAAAGDLDGDGRTDLVVGGPAGLRVFLGRAGEKPTDLRFTAYDGTLPDGGPIWGVEAARAVTALVLWDLDHDGDLDLFAGGEPNRVYRTVVEHPTGSDPYLRFEEVAGTLGLEAPPATDALMMDVDDDQDVDLLVTGPQGNAWFENRRQLRFQRRALPAGDGLAAGDVDNDLLEEAWIGGTVHEWRGGAWRRMFGRSALLDVDSDGILDRDPLAGVPVTGAVRRVVVADLNLDDGGPGGRDLLVATDRGLAVLLSRTDRPHAWIDVQPVGRETNEAGIGTRVALFADDLRVGAMCRDGLLSFGLGPRTVIDALMLRWTNGIEQGLTGPGILSCTTVVEREGEVGSCPFLYAFDGERWHFIADCQSGTPLGLPYADGRYLPPRPNETILVPGARLRAVDGRLRLDLAEEFRELFFVDQVVLRAIDRPAGARPVLNEGFRVFHHPEFAVHALADLRPPHTALDGRGRDILPLVAARDGRHAVVWEPLDSRYVGLAREWTITLDFGDLSAADRILFVMDGWVEFPTASASIAASRSSTVHFMPPVLEVVGEDGGWFVADKDPGFPAGKGKAVLVDLTGKFPGRDGRIRIRSTQRIHWDAFSISTGADGPLRLTEVPLVRADHHFRGIGERIDDPSGERPWTYSHDRLVDRYVYDQMPAGMLTRYGDVRELVATIDDRYPVLAAGDVVALEFDASALPPLPEGWTRDYCFTTEGWVKDADMNQAVRERVGPLPFHAMSAYPYDETGEHHPHPDFVREWFTRPARRLVDPADHGATKPPDAPRVKRASR